MTNDEAAPVLAALTAAWPWAEWPTDHLELLLAALAGYEQAPAMEAARRAVLELERPPSVAWLRKAILAEQDRYSEHHALPEAPVDPDVAREGIAEARKAIANARGGVG